MGLGVRRSSKKTESVPKTSVGAGRWQGRPLDYEGKGMKQASIVLFFFTYPTHEKKTQRCQ